MEPAESIIEVLDHEGNFEYAARTLVMTIDGVPPVFTPEDAAIEKPSHRIEILFSPGSESGAEEIVDDTEVPSSWRGTLTIQIIAKPADYEQVRKWRSMIRFAAMKWKTTMNALLEHCDLVSFRCAQSTPALMTDTGTIAATLRYDVNFALVPGRLAELSSTGE